MREQSADRPWRRKGLSRVEYLRSARKISFKGRKLWKRLKQEFVSAPEDCEEMEELASGDSGSRYELFAQKLLSKTWFELRTPKLAAAVASSGSVCGIEDGGVAVVESFTMAKRLKFENLFDDGRPENKDNPFFRISELLEYCSAALSEHDDIAELMLAQLSDELIVWIDWLTNPARSFGSFFPSGKIQTDVSLETSRVARLENWFIDEWLKSANRSYEHSLTSLIADRPRRPEWSSQVDASPHRFVERILQNRSLWTSDDQVKVGLDEALPVLLRIGETRKGRFLESLISALGTSSPEVIGQLAQLEEFDRFVWLQRLVCEYPKPPTADVTVKIWKVWFERKSEVRLGLLRSWNEPMQILKGQTDGELSKVLVSYVLLGRFDDLASQPMVGVTRILGLLLEIADVSIRNSVRYGIHGETWASQRKYLTDFLMHGEETNPASVADAQMKFDPLDWMLAPWSSTLPKKVSAAQMICEALEIVPDDEIDRAMFFLLTSQIDKLLAFDPELELLSLGYVASSDEFRERLRPLLNANPRLNIGRILASVLRQDRLARLKDNEVAYFLEHFLQRREFGSVWKLAQNHSTFTLIWILARLERLENIEDPADQDFSEIIEKARDVLRRYAPSLLTNEPGPLAGFAATRTAYLNIWNSTFSKHLATIKFDGRINDFSFSPDGLRLAVAGSNRVIGEIDLADGKLRQKLVGFGASVGSIAYCGNRSIVAAERTNRNGKVCHVWICEEGTTPREAQFAIGSITSTVSVGDGSVQYATKDGAIGLIRVDESGRALQAAHVKLTNLFFTYARALAENSKGALNVLFAAHGVVIRNSDLSEVDVMHGVRPIMRRAAWLDNKHVVASDHAGRLHHFSVDEMLENLHRGESIQVAERIADFAVIPGTDELIMQVPGSLLLYKCFPPTYLARTNRQGTSVQISQDGSLLASGDERGDIVLYDLSVRAIPQFASKPIGLMSPVDLPRYQRAAVAIPVEKSSDPTVKTLIAITEIMLMLVRFRFRHDIFLDEPMTLRSGEYDIVLGGELIDEDDQGEVAE